MTLKQVGSSQWMRFGCFLFVASFLVASVTACSKTQDAVSNQSAVRASSAPSPVTSTQSPEGIRQDQAVAVAASGCLGGWLDDAEVSMYPGLVLGAVLDHGIETGNIDRPSDKTDDAEIFRVDFWKNEYMTQAFETAAALDTSYQPLSDLWGQATSKAIKAWEQGGISTLDATRRSNSVLKKLEARCKVPVTFALERSRAESQSLEAWIRVEAEGLLPADFETYNG